MGISKSASRGEGEREIERDGKREGERNCDTVSVSKLQQIRVLHCFTNRDMPANRGKQTSFRLSEVSFHV